MRTTRRFAAAGATASIALAAVLASGVAGLPATAAGADFDPHPAPPGITGPVSESADEEARDGAQQQSDLLDQEMKTRGVARAASPDQAMEPAPAPSGCYWNFVYHEHGSVLVIHTIDGEKHVYRCNDGSWEEL